MTPIRSLPPPTLAPPGLTSAAPAISGEQAFKNLLLESLDQMNTMQQDADLAVEQLLTGKDVGPAEVLTAVQKTDMTFRLLVQMRNKLVQAYQEIKEIRI